MSTFKDYMNKEKNNVIIHDEHYHVEKSGGQTGPPIRVKTDDGRTTHIHKQSDGKDTVEARDVKRVPDDAEGSGSALPKNGYHDHMQTDGQFTSLQIFPPTEGEESVGGISEKIEAILESAKIEFDDKAALDAMPETAWKTRKANIEKFAKAAKSKAELMKKLWSAPFTPAYEIGASGDHVWIHNPKGKRIAMIPVKGMEK